MAEMVLGCVELAFRSGTAIGVLRDVHEGSASESSVLHGVPGARVE